MKNYRIRKETKFSLTRYYPQRKFLFWWLDIFKWEHHDGGFHTFEQAQENLCVYLAENKVEYLEVDCSKCGDTSKTVPSTPNPPPKVV